VGVAIEAQEAIGPSLGQPATAPAAGVPAPLPLTTVDPSTLGNPSLVQPGASFSPAVGTSGLQPVNFASRERRAPLDPRIAAMPNQYQKLEVIHHRSQLVIAHNPVARFA